MAHGMDVGEALVRDTALRTAQLGGHVYGSMLNYSDPTVEAMAVAVPECPSESDWKLLRQAPWSHSSHKTVLNWRNGLGYTCVSGPVITCRRSSQT